MDAETISAERELDALITRHIMGWVMNPFGDALMDPVTYTETPPPYSTDIAAAWQVVEFMNNDLQPRVNGLPGATAWAYWWDSAMLWALSASEAAEAICRAALTIVQDGQMPVGLT